MKVQAISGANSTQMEILTEKAKEMGATTAKSATDSAEAFQYMALAGYNVNQMLMGIEPMLKGSVAWGEDLGRTSDLVTKL